MYEVCPRNCTVGHSARRLAGIPLGMLYGLGYGVLSPPEQESDSDLRGYPLSLCGLVKPILALFL